MIVPSSENVYSDDSEDEIEEIDIYRRKYQLLLERCEVLQQVMLSIFVFLRIIQILVTKIHFLSYILCTNCVVSPP